jgi:hypothetical protein
MTMTERDTVAHKARHMILHAALDELVADFVTNTQRLPSETSLTELMEWSYEQTHKPVGAWPAAEGDK